jgi:hypothetical protein
VGTTEGPECEIWKDPQRTSYEGFAIRRENIVRELCRIERENGAEEN